MGYNYPTKEGIEFAMDCGWTREQAERGFEIFNFNGTGMLEIEAICECYPNGNYNDEAAAREAERIGFCKIIPVDELPDPFIYDGISRRYFSWVDTPENRKRIEDYCKEERKKNNITNNNSKTKITATEIKLWNRMWDDIEGWYNKGYIETVLGEDVDGHMTVKMICPEYENTYLLMYFFNSVHVQVMLEFNNYSKFIFIHRHRKESINDKMLKILLHHWEQMKINVETEIKNRIIRDIKYNENKINNANKVLEALNLEKKETEYPVVITEKFNKLIVVKANSEEEAIEKCWNEFSNGCLFNNSPVSIDYLTCDSDVNFEIGTEKDRKLIEEDEDRFDHLD